MAKTRKDFETTEEYSAYRKNESKNERERRSKIRPEINKRENERRSKIRPEINSAETKRRRKDRFDALQAYSEGVPHCLHCGETQIEFLTIDHISGRASMGHAKNLKGNSLYIWLKNHKYPAGFQVLCWNWNEIKGKKDLWRNSPKTDRGKYQAKYSYQIKKEVLTHYSKQESNHDFPICACCGYLELEALTLDHKYGRKNVPKDENKTGHKLRMVLKKKGYPPNYKVLCFNCNSAKSDLGICPHKT